MHDSASISDIEDTTGLLKRWSSGCQASADQALAHLYPDLARFIAQRYPYWAHSFNPSDLLQEVAIRLLDQERTDWSNRGHFFAVVARLIRRVLVDIARQELAQKRNPHESSWLTDATQCQVRPDDLVCLDDLLRNLGGVDPTAVRVIELRYFAGFTVPEAATALGVSDATVVRRWRFARAWLYRRLRPTFPQLQLLNAE